MAKGGFVVHVTDEHELRELASLVKGVLANGHREVLDKIGVQSEQVWIARTKQGPALMIILEADDPEQAIRSFLTIDDPPISIWLREVASNTTEITDALERPMELLLEIDRGELANDARSPATR